MSNRDRRYIALPLGICKEIDNVMKSALIYGEPKYMSRPDFVNKAVIEQLHKEKVSKEVIA